MGQLHGYLMLRSEDRQNAQCPTGTDFRAGHKYENVFLQQKHFLLREVRISMSVCLSLRNYSHEN